MSVQSKYYRPIDDLLVLRDEGSPAVTVTTATDVIIPLDYINQASVVVEVESLDLSSGNETYALEVEVSTDAAFTSPGSVGKIPLPAIGFYSMNVVRETIERVVPGAQFLRGKLVLSGTTPSIAASVRVSTIA